MKRLLALILAMLFVITGCNYGNDQEQKQWKLIEQSATGTTVTVAVQHSNKKVIEWLKNEFATFLASTYEIKLKVIDQPLGKTIDELSANKANEVNSGEYDIIIFESEGFKNALNKGLLYGPFADKLPKVQSTIDVTALNYLYREGIETQNYIVPYGRNELSFIYNQDVFYEKPMTYEEFFGVVKSFKGQFTYPNPATSKEGEAFILSVIGQYVDLEPFISGTIDQAKFISAIQPGLDALKAIKPYLKDEGKIYPASTQEMDDLYNNGALMMSLSMDYNYATDKLKEYEYPENTSTFVIPEGVATFTEGASIAFNSPNKSGAMVALNALLDPEMQTSKYNPKLWGSLTSYTLEVTPKINIDALKTIKLKSTTVKYDDFLESVMTEFSPEMRTIIIKQWQSQVLGN
ncbi:ABC transporter substrate-binding protein [Fusibacter bizertensis]